MSITTSGLHHVTAIAGRAQANIEYYVRLLGHRLVKRTVNYDDPLTYHLYFGDALGNPGSILTFFPWPGAGPAERGSAETSAIALRVPSGALDYWRDTLSFHRQSFEETVRFGAPVLSFSDPDGTPLELVEGSEPPAPPAPPGEPTSVAPPDHDRQAALPLADILRPSRVWTNSPVESQSAIIGLDAVTLTLIDRDASTELLVETLGYSVVGEEDGRLRLALPGDATGRSLDLLSAVERRPARLGTGSVHHVAFRVPDRVALDAAREQLVAAGVRPTKVKNRVYFQSIYFTDPSGAILELATDGPGFTADESHDELGLGLKLPTWLEPEREYFRSRLPVTASPEYADRFG
ncbi:MAG TPA: VOC family protein [Trueperaceae bacterium]|nr:VOC family protein [Trueperaceae bacterium]